MRFIDNMLSKYKRFLEKRRAIAREIDIREEEKKKKYYLDNFGAYHNADELTREEMLEIFWRMLKQDVYDPSNFNENTHIIEPAKQDWAWDDLGCEGFIGTVFEMFDISEYDFENEEYQNVKTFGELADLVIKKAKEKKLKEGQDKEEVR